MPFALDGNPTQSELVEAVNYLLGNFPVSSVVDPESGQIISPGGNVTGYLYQYMAVKYADSYDGVLNFSNTPTNREYYGLRNSADAAESSNPADYVWYKAAGGFGTTKFLWYVTTGGRQIQFAVSTTAPDTAWLVDPGSSIDLDVVTSSTTPVIAESFLPYFAPSTLLVPRTGNPLAPSFTGVVASMYATDAGVIVPFSDAQTDSNVGFVNNSWRIGNSSTTGNGDISYTNITVGNPTDGGDYAVWPAPTAMPSSPAFITVPVRYKNNSGVVSQAGVATIQYTYADPGPAGLDSPYIDISGYTGFTVNAGGAFSPPTATLSAITSAVTSPAYSWSITGATPTSSINSTVVITPNSSVTSVSVTLTVSGTNLPSPISKTVTMPVAYDGAPGQAGANGVMSAFPSIYIWTGSSSTPTRPSTTSTYTWATGAYTAPAGWSTTAPTNTTPGNYLWQITIPLNTTATTVTSTLDWTNTSYPIRCITSNGSNGSATFLVTRSANDSSAPTNSEVNAVIGRDPVAGDIVTVSYNSGNSAVVYRYTTTWVTQATYITGSLIVSGTITADKLSVSQLSAISANLGSVTAGELTITEPSSSVPTISGTTMTGAGTHLYSDGRFAMGNSSTNIVFNGTTATLNGFTSGPQASSSIVNVISGYQTIGTMSLSKSGLTLFGFNGDLTIYDQTAYPGTTLPSLRYIAGGQLLLQIINSSSTVVANITMNFGGACVLQSAIISPAGRAAVSTYYGTFSYQLPITLSADTYTIKALATGTRRDGSGNDLGTVSGAGGGLMSSKVFFFQVAA